MLAKVVLLKDIFCKEIGHPSLDLVTRQMGEWMRGLLEKELMDIPEPCVCFLSMDGMGIIDYSCADEIIAKMVSACKGGKYGDRYFVLEALNASQTENIDAALERRGLSVLYHMGAHAWDILGNLNSYLRETLAFVMEKEACTVKEMSNRFELELNNSGTRLLNLHKRRLVFRQIETVGDRANRFVYKNLLIYR